MTQNSWNSTTPVEVAKGGTGNTTLTLHGVLLGEGTSAVSATSAGLANQVLQSGGASADPAYSTATYPSTTTINQILYSSAANAVAGLASANSATLVTSSAGVPSLTASMTNGQVLIGSTGATPTPSTITAGSGIIITPGAGTITIATISVGQTWTVISSNQTLAVNNGYFVGSGSLSLLLPATSSVGDVIDVVLDGGTAWTITQAASQLITFGNVSTTTGVTGTLASSAVGDSVHLVCRTANLAWFVTSSIGNILVI